MRKRWRTSTSQFWMDCKSNTLGVLKIGDTGLT